MVSLRLKTLKLRLKGIQTMTVISAYVSTLDAPKDSKKIFYDKLSVVINAIHGKRKKYNFRQDLEGRNEAASSFVFLTQKLRELGQTHGAEKAIGYPISQLHVLSLVPKLGESGWAQRSYSLGYMSK